jgi:hypothetical protein
MQYLCHQINLKQKNKFFNNRSKGKATDKSPRIHTTLGNASKAAPESKKANLVLLARISMAVHAYSISRYLVAKQSEDQKGNLIFEIE